MQNDHIVHQQVEYCCIICDVVCYYVRTETELSVKDVMVTCHVWIPATHQVRSFLSQFVAA